MPPRECDNDDCDYVTFVDARGVPCSRWVHVEGCEGPIEFPPLDPKDVRPGSFAAFLLGGS